MGKLVGGFFLSGAIALALSGTGYYAITTTAADIDEIGEVRVPTLNSILHLSVAQMEIRAINNTLMNAGFTSAEREQMRGDLTRVWRDIEAAWTEYESLPHTPEETALWREFQPAFAEWKKMASEFLTVNHAWERALASGHEEAERAAYEEGRTKLVAIRASFATCSRILEDLIKVNVDICHREVVESQARAQWLTTLMLILGTSAVFVTLTLGIFITRSITVPLRNTFKGLKTCSTHELRETGQTLLRIIGGMSEGADQVNDAAAQVSAVSQQLAEGASEQASSLEETSAALEEVSAMTRQNATNAKDANQVASEANVAAQDGEKTMSGINEASDKISKIIKVIEEIAFQTNLLALNAAVEAARAGEHGKGFAVVAEEVRNLAQRAAGAAKETTSLIEESVAKSRDGVSAIKAIVSGVTRVSELVSGISSASDEQAEGVQQVTTAVSQMDQVTQSNAAGAEEAASAAEELAAQAASVKGLVGELLALVENTSTATSNSVPPRRLLNTVHAAHTPLVESKVGRTRAKRVPLQAAPVKAAATTGTTDPNLNEF
ncbi:MAG: MCP four helix bundle domain-containing protein [Phycisphaerales bacterium]|nr:MCP four helix bundle domain-containing protein [Phycisphaerales bacterium]